MCYNSVGRCLELRRQVVTLVWVDAMTARVFHHQTVFARRATNCYLVHPKHIDKFIYFDVMNNEMLDEEGVSLFL
ncbi:hypothetical protein QVD17_19776 [Tagetes erecta]|uniref:Uncharacterized protein n=1 Tax=Tagetes erecta TaxID=13708 RepID=A0AAD8KNA8_TARER|nr:hypothetical protein QVD17_19776 [Tagetes erecta]